MAERPTKRDQRSLIEQEAEKFGGGIEGRVYALEHRKANGNIEVAGPDLESIYQKVTGKKSHYGGKSADSFIRLELMNIHGFTPVVTDSEETP